MCPLVEDLWKKFRVRMDPGGASTYDADRSLTSHNMKYTYSFDGKRISKEEDTVKTDFLYDGMQMQ